MDNLVGMQSARVEPKPHARQTIQATLNEFVELVHGPTVSGGKLLLREIDKGLRNSRVGIVLVTPALLKSIEAEGIAEKELSVLLASGRVIPVAHGTTFEALRDVSPILASNAGLDTAESSLEDVAEVAAAAAALAEDDG